MPSVRYYIVNKESGASHPVFGSLSIGRLDGDLTFSEDKLLSKKHLTLYISEEGQLIAKDLGARNGTFVDEQKLTEPTPLFSGQTLKVGQQEFKIIAKSNWTQKYPHIFRRIFFYLIIFNGLSLILYTGVPSLRSLIFEHSKEHALFYILSMAIGHFIISLFVSALGPRRFTTLNLLGNLLLGIVLMGLLHGLILKL